MINTIKLIFNIVKSIRVSAGRRHSINTEDKKRIKNFGRIKIGNLQKTMSKWKDNIKINFSHTARDGIG